VCVAGSTQSQPERRNGSLYDAIIFDLLTALIDSWTLWNSVAGTSEAGLRWRHSYLRLTYGAGCYRPYETIVAEAAIEADIAPGNARILVARWGELEPWPEAVEVLQRLSETVRLATVTNCSIRLGHIAAESVFSGFDTVVTAEDAGFYKPHPRPYAKTLEALGTDPGRTLFVAGSASDVPGALALGMPVYWHNRIGMPTVGSVPHTYLEPCLNPLLDFV
jgi:2-haloalkanoic acid dehalogenase type II